MQVQNLFLDEISANLLHCSFLHFSDTVTISLPDFFSRYKHSVLVVLTCISYLRKINFAFVLQGKDISHVHACDCNFRVALYSSVCFACHLDTSIARRSRLFCANEGNFIFRNALLARARCFFLKMRAMQNLREKFVFAFVERAT